MYNRLILNSVLYKNEKKNGQFRNPDSFWFYLGLLSTSIFGFSGATKFITGLSLQGLRGFKRIVTGFVPGAVITYSSTLLLYPDYALLSGCESPPAGAAS